MNYLCAHVVFEIITDGGWHNLSRTSDGLGGLFEQIAGVLAIQTQEKSPLTINTYLLKHNSVTIMDADKEYREKAWRQLHKNTASSIEQILEATSHKAGAVRPPASHL